MKRILTAIVAAVLLAGVACAQYVAQDPTRYVPNGRVLGLGKAYIALADDTGAMYTNPAGMGDVSGWQLSSMSGKFLDEYSYLSFSGLYPTEYGVFGFGYAGTSIAGAFATTIEAGSDPADPIYTIDPSQPTMGNDNAAMVFSYGNKADKIPYVKQVPQADKITLGTSVKLFRARLYGDGIQNGDASGQELDFGIKYTPLRWLALGMAVQNALPAGLGGKLTYSGGHEESYPAVIETGAAFSVLGKDKALAKYGDHELKIMTDIDLHPSLAGYPPVMHLGAEWKPVSILAIRAGIDQDAGGDGNGGLTTYSDPTYGVGMYFGGFRFDYAYHAFAGAPNIDNHFFSLSYNYLPPAVESSKDPFTFTSPDDKTITFAGATRVHAHAANSRIRTATINGQPVKMNLKGDISTEVELKIGKNGIILAGSDDRGKLVGSSKVRLLRLTTFPDVVIGYWVDKPISLLAMQNIITGYPDGTFKPEGGISRAEMCSLLMKTRKQNASTAEAALTAAAFKDVPGKHWASAFVAEAAALGVVKGYPGNVFKPNGKITRAEGLAMIARFAGVSEETYARDFPDVAGNHWAAKIIAGSNKVNILQYLKGLNFEPNKQLTRAETVEMLYRTDYVQQVLKKDLLNWDTY
ncbi:MAG: S-layer homology domain-containing protein [Candidatus Margulisiibacteriota bacterium]